MRIFLWVPIFILAYSRPILAKELKCKDGAKGLFCFHGKVYNFDDISDIRTKQLLHELQEIMIRKGQSVVDHHIIDLYFERKAKGDKKLAEDLKKKELSPKMISDAEVKSWYDQNKLRLGGRKLKSLQKEIKHHLQQKNAEEQKNQLLTTLKKNKSYKFLWQGPIEAPKVAIDLKGFPQKGAKNPKVVIVEYADYQCPHCREAAKVLREIAKEFPNQVSLVYKDFPINPSKISTHIAGGAYCAMMQNRFWEYNNLAFEEQQTLKAKSSREIAKKMNLNLSMFDKCLASSDAKKHVVKSKNEGEKIGVRGTPAIFINGEKHIGYDKFSIIKKIKKMI